jgi:hypothetical protein
VFRWFDYKQGYAAQLVDHFVDAWSLGPGSRLLDPFAGCGTTLVAAKRRELPALGIEILPSAAFACHTKLLSLDAEVADRLQEACRRIVRDLRRAPTATVPADVVLLPKAFSPEVLGTLWALSADIRSHASPSLRALLLLAFFTILEPSGRALKDGNSIKIVDKRASPDPCDLFQSAADRIAADIRSDEAWLRARPRQHVVLADSRALPLRDEPRWDALVTSPPYLNRYDYARLYSMEEALGFGRGNAEIIRLRRRQLRGHVEVTFHPSQADRLSPAEAEICRNLGGRRLNNPKILDMVGGYFVDLERVVRSLAPRLRSGGRAAWVVGNVIHGAEHIPVDLLLADRLAGNGFRIESILVTRHKGNSSQHMARFGRHPVRESIVVAERT